MIACKQGTHPALQWLLLLTAMGEFLVGTLFLANGHVGGAAMIAIGGALVAIRASLRRRNPPATPSH